MTGKKYLMFEQRWLATLNGTLPNQPLTLKVVTLCSVERAKMSGANLPGG